MSCRDICVLHSLAQVIKRDGSRGLVPKSYVQVAEEDEDNSDAFSLAGRSNVSGSQVQVGASGAARHATDDQLCLTEQAALPKQPALGLTWHLTTILQCQRHFPEAEDVGG